jgi:hypothetical protein
MPWLPLYLDEVDAADLLGLLNVDNDLAFIFSTGPGQWVARRAMDVAADGRHCLWHTPVGPLPLLRGVGRPEGVISDPWAGWTEEQAGADPSQPYFGPGHPGIIWWNLRTRSSGMRGGLGLSSFEWIGNYYRLIGSPSDPRTEVWWAQLRKAIKRRQARRIPRQGPLDGPHPEIWAMPSALAKIESGTPRDGNP